MITLYDWRLMFVILGAVGLIWLVPWLLFVSNDKPKAVQTNPAKPTVVETVPFRNLMASPVIWGTVIINFCYNYFVFYCMTWMLAYFVEHRGVSLTKMGLFSFFSFVDIALVTVLSGWVADLIIKDCRVRHPAYNRTIHLMR